MAGTATQSSGERQSQPLSAVGFTAPCQDDISQPVATSGPCSCLERCANAWLATVSERASLPASALRGHSWDTLCTVEDSPEPPPSPHRSISSM